LNTLAKGSAATALEVEPSFDSFFFIEKHKERFEELKKLREKYPAKKAYMKFECADANEALARICSESNWHSSRAVLFLDPYGMQVDWKTLEKVAGTKAIDTWMLFPVGMGVDRLLPRDGDVPNEWQAALDRMLGSRSWREAFYAESNEQGDLLSERRPQRIKLAGPAAVEEYFLGRLKSVFAGVGRRGLPLKNSRGYLMYLLCFACGNPRATKVALGIANHLLKS
jgi:three-Cys-motif partner protein